MKTMINFSRTPMNFEMVGGCCTCRSFNLHCWSWQSWHIKNPSMYACVFFLNVFFDENPAVLEFPEIEKNISPLKYIPSMLLLPASCWKKKKRIEVQPAVPGKVTLMPDHQHVWASQRFFGGASKKTQRTFLAMIS